MSYDTQEDLTFWYRQMIPGLFDVGDAVADPSKIELDLIKLYLFQCKYPTLSAENIHKSAGLYASGVSLYTYDDIKTTGGSLYKKYQDSRRVILAKQTIDTGYPNDESIAPDSRDEYGTTYIPRRGLRDEYRAAYDQRPSSDWPDSEELPDTLSPETRSELDEFIARINGLREERAVAAERTNNTSNITGTHHFYSLQDEYALRDSTTHSQTQYVPSSTDASTGYNGWDRSSYGEYDLYPEEEEEDDIAYWAQQYEPVVPWKIVPGLFFIMTDQPCIYRSLNPKSSGTNLIRSPTS